ncbi:MAG: GLUG motif-containing protein [Planctomycetota bacterium]
MNVNLLLCRGRRLISAIMILGILLCSRAYPYSFESGTGEPYDPYEISNAEQLLQIGSDLSLMNKNFILTSDIDLDPNLPGGRVFRTAVIAHSVDDDRSNQSYPVIVRAPGVTVAVFHGTFSGNGHSVRNMTIDAPGGKCIGLFGYVGDDAVINDLRIEHARVVGEQHVGLLAGINNGTISYCRCSGSISGNDRVGGLIGTSKGSVACCQSKTRVAGKQIVGGLIGHALSKSSIVDCKSRGDVTGESDVGGLIGGMLRGTIIGCSASGHISSQTNAGGLAGRGPYGGSIVRCRSSAEIKGALVGGLVGIAQYTNIMHCHATGVLTGIEPTGTMSDSMAGIGGLVGYWKASKGSITSCCWDREAHVIGASTVDEAVASLPPGAKVRLISTKGATTLQMKTASGPAVCLTNLKVSERLRKNKHRSRDRTLRSRTKTDHNAHEKRPHAKAKLDHPDF